MRKRILGALLPIFCLALLTGVLLARSGGNDPPGRLALSTTASADDGAAYVKEAIDNLRGTERFRFAQTVTGASTPGDPGTGEVTGEVELARNPAAKPKMRSTVKLHRTGSGEEVGAEQVVIGDVLHTKGPGRANFARSSNKPTVAKGKSHGRSEDVEVVDPVMLLLEPVDTLPPSAFARPSDLDAGNRSVGVNLPGGRVLTIVIRDADRLIVGLSLTSEGKTAAFSLKDFGASNISITPPGS